MRYTIRDLQRDFPDEDACLEWLVNDLNPDGITCRKCERVTKHYKVRSRRSYSCGECGLHYHPTAGTIFEGTKLPLTTWFYAMYFMAGNKAGTPATLIQRQLGVTYATAWRMMHKIRELMDSTDVMFAGDVEVDETFVHANTFKRSSARRRYGADARRTGWVIFGMLHRQSGHVKVWHVLDTNFKSLLPFIQENVTEGSTIHSDGYYAYRKLPSKGYGHKRTDHGKHQWVNENDSTNHTQNIENVWSHFKRGIKGVYRSVGVKHIQKYADEYAYRYSHRSDPSIFWSLLSEISGTSRASSVPPSLTDRKTVS